MMLKRLILVVLVLLGAACPSAAGTCAVDGDWDGTLMTGPTNKRVTFHITTENGITGGRLISVDEGNGSISLSSVSCEAAKIDIVIGKIKGAYQGTITPDGKTISGNWSQNGGAIPLTLTRRTAGSASFTASAAPQTPEAWRKAAATDLTAMHDMLRDNAPQMFVERDSAHFRKWLEAGYVEAQGRLPRVQDYNGYIYLLRGYAGGFRDVHLRVGGGPGDRKWPGFATAWKDGAYVVSMNTASAKDRQPPVGAKLIDCDGRTAEELARSRLDKYSANLDLYYGRASTASQLLFDLGNPYVEPLKTCRFQAPSGIEEFPLTYRSIPKGDLGFKAPRARFGLTQAAPKVWRIGLPGMHAGMDWPHLYADIDAHSEDIRNGDRLIIDLRGNGGGASGYTSALATRLWGTAVAGYYTSISYHMVYPATPLMRQGIADSLRKQNLEGKVDNARFQEKLLADLDKAIAEGRKTITVVFETPPAQGKPPANPMKAQVFVVTDYVCTSSCLDLMDRLLAFPNVYHAGTQTGADTIFNEVETHRLPSDLAFLTYGHKAFIGRPRGSNVPYTPKPELTYRGDLADEAAFERWLAALPAQPSH